MTFVTCGVKLDCNTLLPTMGESLVVVTDGAYMIESNDRYGSPLWKHSLTTLFLACFDKDEQDAYRRECMSPVEMWRYCKRRSDERAAEYRIPVFY